MAHISRFSMDEYPYRGRFYNVFTPDYSLPLDERKEREEMVYETVCDIQEVSKANNPVLIATFAVYFPFPKSGSCPIVRGMSFKGSMAGIDVSGIITNVVPSQVGGITAYVKDYDANESL